MHQVVRAEDPQLQDKLPLAAWTNGGLDRPDRTFVDRRDDSDRAIREELRSGPTVEDRARQRLRAVTGQASNTLSPFTFYFFIGICLAVLILFATYGWRAYRQRVARAEARRGERVGREF